MSMSLTSSIRQRVVTVVTVVAVTMVMVCMTAKHLQDSHVELFIVL